MFTLETKKTQVKLLFIMEITQLELDRVTMKRFLSIWKKYLQISNQFGQSSPSTQAIISLMMFKERTVGYLVEN